MNARSLAAPEERDRRERALEMDDERGEADDAPIVEEGTEAEGGS
jgi:hypothetical protein